MNWVNRIVCFIEGHRFYHWGYEGWYCKRCGIDNPNHPANQKEKVTPNNGANQDKEEYE